jgi:hypothetical protein
VTGGAVFGTPWFVPALALILVIAGRSSLRMGLPRPLWLVAVLGITLLVTFAGPAIAGGSGVRTGDSPWHLGWSEQLLGGEPVPTGPAPEYGRNAYPWGWHAVIATLVRLVPGSTPLVAYESLHLLLLAAIPLSAAVLARRLDPDAGWTAAIAVAFIGGFGWIVAGDAAFDATPADARFGADLVAASPNGLYALFPPALPRELGLVLVASVFVILATSIDLHDRRIATVAGIATGIVGLVSVPLLAAAVLWLLACTWRKDRWDLLGRALLPAALVFALWAGPVVSLFVRHGGFVSITPKLGVEWPLHTALASWGLLAPLAVLGVVLAWRRRVSDPLFACAVASVVLLVFAIARGELGWRLANNATLLHQGRAWPVVHLLAAAFAGVALWRLFVWLRDRSRAFAVAGAAAVLFLGGASPVLASQGLAEIIDKGDEGWIYASADLQRPSFFVTRAADVLGPDDVVRVEGSDRLAFLLFQFSGVKLAAFDDPQLESNDLRIRYEELAAAWDRRVSGPGFEADFVAHRPRSLVPFGGPLRDPPWAPFEGRDWILVRE